MVAAAPFPGCGLDKDAQMEGEGAAPLSSVPACVLGSGKGKERQDVGGGVGLLGKRKGGGLWEFYRVCGFKEKMIRQ